MTPADEWQATLAETGELDARVARQLIDAHGSRGTRAIEAVAERRVKEYRDFTVVVGHAEEYVVEDGGCQCKDSQYNLDPTNPNEHCWHVIAVDLARGLGAVDHHDMWYSEVREFL